MTHSIGGGEQHGGGRAHHSHDCREREGNGFKLHAHVHDGASVVTFETPLPSIADEIPQKLRDLVAFVVAEAQAHRGTIGHVKALATDGATAYWVSGTGAGLSAKQTKPDAVSSHRASLSFAAIVFRISWETLEHIVRRGWQQWNSSAKDAVSRKEA